MNNFHIISDKAILKAMKLLRVDELKNGHMISVAFWKDKEGNCFYETSCGVKRVRKNKE